MQTSSQGEWGPRVPRKSSNLTSVTKRIAFADNSDSKHFPLEYKKHPRLYHFMIPRTRKSIYLSIRKLTRNVPIFVKKKQMCRIQGHITRFFRKILVSRSYRILVKYLWEWFLKIHSLKLTQSSDKSKSIRFKENQNFTLDSTP